MDRLTAAVKVVLQVGMHQSASFGPEPFTERLRLIAGESATRLAIIYPRPVTYGALLRQAIEVARGLRARHLEPGAPVPVWIGSPIDGLTASLGVALAGGAYVPIDPRAPLARARFVVEDCRPGITIVDHERAPLMSGQGTGEALTIEQLAARGGDGPAHLEPVGPQQAACIIYTSGSTGQPKGVVLTHANLSSMLALRRAVHGTASRVLPVHPCSFDAFLGAVLWSLASGGALALLEGEQILDPEAIVGVIERHGVATISAVPSMYQALLRTAEPGRLASLRSAILGGEVMTAELASLHFSQLKGASLFNEYGPTECTVFSTAYRVPQFAPTPIPIGTPVGDVDCQVVSAAGVPCGPLEEGELYIGGPGVAQGYWRQEALTAERFVTAPALAKGPRFYRTGDRVRWNGRGELEFLGRMDDQIKLRGNRIEPAEIERAIFALPGVLSAAAVLHDGGPDQVAGAGPRLVAFYVTERGEPLAEPRLRLAEQLPSYMMPSVFARLDAMPTLSNGKIDRRALARLPLAAEGPRPAASPLLPAERQVAEVWARVLGVPVESLGPDSDFFGLGGHSLLVTAVRGTLARELGRTAPEELFFSRSRLGELARALSPIVPADETTATSAASPSALPLAPVQETFYVLAQIEPESAAYVVPATLKISGPLDRARLRAAARAVVAGNELLRARVERRGDEPILIVAPLEEEESWFRWEERDLIAGEAAGSVVEAFEAAPIALGGPSLARFQLLRVSGEEHYLTLAAHHIVVDGASVGLIVAELLAAYRDPEGQAPAKAPYAAFVATSRSRLSGERLERLHAFWKEHLRSVSAPVLPHDYLPSPGAPAGNVRQHRPTSVVRPLPAQLAARLHACARAQRTTPFVTALGAVGLTLGRWLPDRELVVGSPVSLRGLGPFEATVGCMVNSVAIKLDLGSGQQTFAQLVGEVRAGVLESMRHAELPIAWLHAGRGRTRGDAAVPLFRTFFNYLDRGPQHLQLGPLRFEPQFARRPVPKFDLTIYVHDWGHRMDLELVYPPERYDERTIQALARQLEEVLEQVTEAPDLTVDVVRLDRQPVVALPAPPPAFEATAPIHGGFVAATRSRPSDLAVTDEQGASTYRELAGRAAQVTASLEAAGLRPGARVAIVGSRDTAFVAGVIGALEAGCVFTVLEPAAPPSVRQAVLDVFRPDLTLDPHGQLGASTSTRGHSGTFSLRSPPPLVGLCRNGDAYALFTSGTSSRKKGVLGTHAPVVRFLAWQARAFGLGPQDRFALLAGLGHDPMLRDLFAPLSCGGSLYVPGQTTRDDPRLLAAFLNRNRVTVLHITPPLAANLTAVGETLPAVRLIFCGGDRLSPEQAQRLLDVAPNARLMNGYGLTETPQIIVCHEVERGVPLASIPIGTPVPGARVEVERRAGEPCAIGELGEIVVYGDHVAKGLLMAEGVVPLGGADGFRSGDRARRDTWGRIHCLGRRDRERKIRGFRVALDEVEEALRAVPGVERARAVVRGEAGTERLAAFVVADRSHTSEARIRTALAARMQPAAVPHQVVILQALPLSANGKVDDVALANWDLSTTEATRPPALEARTQTEDLIVRVWRDELGTEAVGIADDFFDLGGDSIRAVSALSRLSAELGTPIAVEVLMRNPTPAALASALLSQARHLQEPLVVKVNESGSRPPLWMFHPIGGHVLFIRRLGAELGPDQPVFGVQARGLDGVQSPIDSMDDLVALYSGLVRQHQTRGPYFLGGPSFGGRIAFEVAQQLRQQGESVAMIAMFDSYAPGFPVLAPHHRLWSHLERHRRRWPWLIPERPLAAVREWLSGHEVAAGQPEAGGPEYLGGLDVNRGALERSVREVIAANQRAAKSRPTAYYPGRVNLFRAEIQPVEDFKADFSDVKNGWGRYACEVTVDIVKGTHHHIMDFPSLTQLVALFKARLEECRLAGAAGQ